MKKQHKSHNEHGFDCVDFCSLASPHRWSAVSDFLSDKNGTVNFKVDQDNSGPPTYGSCGPHPDEALIIKEPIDQFELVADELGWDMATRRVEAWFYERTGRCNRVSCLYAQIEESLRTGDVSCIKTMTSEESHWFLGELYRRRSVADGNGTRDSEPAPCPITTEPIIQAKSAA